MNSNWLRTAALTAAILNPAAGYAEDSGADEIRIVESIRKVPHGKHPAWLAELIEHTINPETTHEPFGDATAVTPTQ